MGDSSSTTWEKDDPIENNQNIKFAEAVELVKIFWKHEDIVTIDVLIKYGPAEEENEDDEN